MIAIEVDADFLQHYGVPGMEHYKHKYGKWQKQAKYANGVSGPTSLNVKAQSNRENQRDVRETKKAYKKARKDKSVSSDERRARAVDYGNALSKESSQYEYNAKRFLKKASKYEKKNNLKKYAKFNGMAAKELKQLKRISNEINKLIADNKDVSLDWYYETNVYRVKKTENAVMRLLSGRRKIDGIVFHSEF